MNKLKLWDQHTHFHEAERAWDEASEKSAKKTPLKGPKNLPKMPGITPETKKNLKWKSFKYMVFQKEGLAILKHLFKHPLRYGLNYIKSLQQKSSFIRDEDFFYYGLKDTVEFEEKLKNPETTLIVGFSYCHKPFECPSGRFTDACASDLENPVCRQCFIGKCMHALPDKKVIPLMIPTVHYIGKKIFEISEKYAAENLLFLITACEMTLVMFGDWGNLAAVRGIGVRLDGRICNTMKAFELSERGVKPGLTVVTPKTQKRMLELIRKARLNPLDSKL